MNIQTEHLLTALNMILQDDAMKFMRLFKALTDLFPLILYAAKNRRDSSHNTDLGSQNRDSVERHEVNPSEDKQLSTPNHKTVIPTHGESNLDLNNGRNINESGERRSEELVHSTLNVQQRNAGNDDEPHHENGEISDGDNAEEASICSSSHERIIAFSGECIVDPDVEENHDESGDSSTGQLVRRKLGERLNYARNDDESRAVHEGPSGFPNQVYREEECAYHENGELPYQDDAPEQEEYSISSPEITIPSSGECSIDPTDVKDQKESGDVSQEQLAHIKSSECLNNAGSNDESQACHDEQPSCSNASPGNADLSGRDPIKTTETSTLNHEVITIPFSGESVLDPTDEKDQKEDEDNHREHPVQISLSKHRTSATNDDQSGSSVRVSFANAVANLEKDKLSSGDRSGDDIVDEIFLSGEESPDNWKETHSNLESSGISNAVATSSIMGTSIPSKILAPRTARVEEHEETISHDTDHRIPVDNFACTEVNHCATGMVKSLKTRSSFAYDGSVSSYDGMDDQFLDRQRRSLKNIQEASDGPRREESLMNNNAVARDSEIPIETRSSWKSLPRENHYGIEYHERNQNDMLQHRRQDMQNRSTLRRGKYQSKLSLLGRDRDGGYENDSVSSSMFDEPHDSRMHSSDSFVEHDEAKVRLLRMVYELQDELEKTCNRNGNVPIGATQKDTWHDTEYPSYSRRRGPQSNYLERHSLSRMTSAVKAVSGPQVNYYGIEHIPHSMQLLPSEHWHNQGARMAHIDHDYYSQYSSCASSPQRFVSAQLSARGIRMQSDHMSHQNHVAKHHLRPVAGGAPFITCYYCLKLLQIPAEFLLVKRRCYRLKCGHCSKILEFSLQSRTHIVPYVPSVAEPPPSEADKLDGYGVAISKSGSREIGDSVVLPRSSRRDEMEKELSSKWSQNKTESLKKSYQSGDPSSHGYKAEKLSSKVGNLSTKSNSPLHRLMGYSSPSQVFRGLNASRRSMQRK